MSRKRKSMASKPWQRPDHTGKRGVAKGSAQYILEEHLCYPRLLTLQFKCPSNSKYFLPLTNMFAGLDKATAVRKIKYKEELHNGFGPGARLTAEQGSLQQLSSKIRPFVISKALLEIDLVNASPTLMVYRALRLNSQLPPDRRRHFRDVFPCWQYYLTDREAVLEIIGKESASERADVKRRVLAVGNGSQKVEVAGKFSQTLHDLVDEARKEFRHVVQSKEYGKRWFRFWQPDKFKRCGGDLQAVADICEFQEERPTTREIGQFMSRLYREDERTVMELVNDHMFDTYDARPSFLTGDGVFYRLDDLGSPNNHELRELRKRLSSIVMLNTKVTMHVTTERKVPVDSDEWESKVDALFEPIKLPPDWTAGDKPVLIDARLVTSAVADGPPLVRDGNICVVFSQTGSFALADGRRLPVTRQTARELLGQECEFVFGPEAFVVAKKSNRLQLDVSECLPRFQDVLVFRHVDTALNYVEKGAYAPVVIDIEGGEGWADRVRALNHRTNKPFEESTHFKVTDIRRKDLPTRPSGTGRTMPEQDFGPGSPRVRVLLAACGLGKTYQVAHGCERANFRRVLVPVPRITLAVGANAAYDNKLDLQVYKNLTAEAIARADRLTIEMESCWKVIAGGREFKDKTQLGRYQLVSWDEIFMLRGAWICGTTNGKNMMRNHEVCRYVAKSGKQVLMDATGEVDGSVKDLITDLFPDDRVEVTRVRGGALDREIIPVPYQMALVLMDRLIRNRQPIMCMFQTLRSKADGLEATVKALNLPAEFMDNIVVISSDSSAETIALLADPTRHLRGKSVFFTSKLVVGVSLHTPFAATFTIGSSRQRGASATALYQMDNRSRAKSIPHYQTLHGFQPADVTFDECHERILTSQSTLKDYVSTLNTSGTGMTVVLGEMRYYRSTETKLCAWEELERREGTGYAYKRISEPQGVVVTSKDPMRMYTDEQVALKKQVAARLERVGMQMDIERNDMTARSRADLLAADERGELHGYIGGLVDEGQRDLLDAQGKLTLQLWFGVFRRFPPSAWDSFDDASALVFSSEHRCGRTKNVRTHIESRSANDKSTLESKRQDYYANQLVLTQGRHEAMFDVLQAAGVDTVPKIGDLFDHKHLIQRTELLQKAYERYRTMACKTARKSRAKDDSTAKNILGKVLSEQLGLKLKKRGDKLRVVADVSGTPAFRLLKEYNSPENIELMTAQTPEANVWRAEVQRRVKEDVARHAKEKRSKKPLPPTRRQDGSIVERGQWTGPAMVDRTVAPMTQVTRAHNGGRDMNVEPVDIHGIPVGRLVEAMQLYVATNSITLPALPPAAPPAPAFQERVAEDPLEAAIQQRAGIARRLEEEGRRQQALEEAAAQQKLFWEQRRSGFQGLYRDSQYFIIKKT